MQDPSSNKHKRKHHSDEAESERRKVKHKKHDDRDEHKSKSKSSSEKSKPSSSWKSFDKPQTSRKIRNLIRALDEALEKDSKDETLDVIGDEAFNRCLDLQITLSQYGSKTETSNVNTSTSTQPTSPDSRNIPKMGAPTSITPWTSSSLLTSFPPLPKILDPTLELSTFVHMGIGSGNPLDLSYERLEWVGDAYLELISTLLIAQTFPSWGPGKASQLRELLVKNLTLAEYSRHYGFDRRAQLPEAIASGSSAERTKVYGDIFEAYVAAVILSDPADGLRIASQWLKDLWSMKVGPDVIYEETYGMKFDSPLWRLRGTAEPVQGIISKDRALSPKEQLYKMIGCKVTTLTYKDAAPERKSRDNKMPIFTVGVYFNGWGENDVRLGIGEAQGKKEAGNIAASMALNNRQLMDVYIEKKQIWVEQQGPVEEGKERRENGGGR